MKKLSIFLLILLVLFFAVVLARDAIIKTTAEKGIEMMTGLKLEIGNFKTGLLKPVVHVQNFKLFNPKDFSDSIMIDIPEVYVNYNLPAILRGEVHLPEVRLTLSEFIVVKNAQGELNLDALKSIQAQKKDRAPADKTTEKTSAESPSIKIDELRLRIGRVVYKDYSRGAAPQVLEFNINIDETYHNIQDPNALVNLIITRALMNTTIASLANFNLKGLQQAVAGTLSGAQKTVFSAADAVTETGKQAVGTITNVLKSPFKAKE